MRIDSECSWHQRTTCGRRSQTWPNPSSLTLGTQLVGRFSVDDDNQFHGFHVREELEETATELLICVVNDMNISDAMASTVDPQSLCLGLTAAGVPDPVALMYDHITPPNSDETVDVGLATSTDHSAAGAFCRAESRITRSVPDAVPC